MRIDIWSDIACPWCWLGKHHLEEAVRRTGVDVQIEMRSFQLNPAPQPTTPAREYLVKKFGSAARVDEAQARLTSMGEAAGITYRFDRALVANTFDAHRLHHFAKSQGKGAELVERFLRAYHGDGEDLADHATLVRLGMDVGLDAEDVERVLGGDEYSDDVRSDARDGARAGVNGVPFFVFDGRAAISGAQPIEVFEQALLQLAKRT